MAGTISENSRVFGQSSRSSLGMPTFQTTRPRASYDSYLQQTRQLELQSQRERLAQQRQRSKLFEGFFGSLTGGGNMNQPGGPDAGGGLFGGFKGLLDTVLGDLSRVGESQRQGINEGFDQSLNNQLALYSDRGLASSNLAGNAFTGVERGRQSALTELEGNLAQRRAGATQQIGLAGLGQQQDMLMQLLSMLGQ